MQLSQYPNQRGSSSFYQLKKFFNFFAILFNIIKEMVTTFAKQLSRSLTDCLEMDSLLPLKEFPSNLLFEMGLRVVGAKLTTAYDFASQHPKETQNRLLKSIMETNKDTEFGKKFNFSKVTDQDSFQSMVPPQSYESLSPFIDRHLQGGRNQLIKENPISYATTSGTTGKPKFIPITDEAQKNSHQAISRMWSYALCSHVPAAIEGKILPIVSPAVEGYAPDGTPVGSTSGQLLKGIGKLFQHKYAVPYEVFEIEDYSARYYAILLLGMTQNVTLLSTANPSTLSLLAQKANEWKDMLLNDIEKGTLSSEFSFPADIRELIEEQLTPNPHWANELRQSILLDPEEMLRPMAFWPNLQLVACWTGGNSGIFIEEMKSWYGHLRVWDLGYLASELRGSMPLWEGESGGALTITENYFEFVKVEDIEKSNPQFLGVDEVILGERYYIFVTTKAGLYRYNINDIVEVNGFCNNTPVITFIQKGKGVTNITGEKLYEEQLLMAVKEASQLTGAQVKFFMALASVSKSTYELYTEFIDDSVHADRASEFVEVVDQLLSQMNVEYKSKRNSLRLKPMEMVMLDKDSFESFKRFRIKQGIREAQIKSVCLTQDEKLVQMLPILSPLKVAV